MNLPIFWIWQKKSLKILVLILAQYKYIPIQRIYNVNIHCFRFVRLGRKRKKLWREKLKKDLMKERRRRRRNSIVLAILRRTKRISVIISIIQSTNTTSKIIKKTNGLLKAKYQNFMNIYYSHHYHHPSEDNEKKKENN